MTATPAGSDPSEDLVRALVEAQDLAARLAAECTAARNEADRAKRRSAELTDSLAFRLGSVLLDALRSRTGVLALPRGLASVMRHWRDRTKKMDHPPVDCESNAPAHGNELPGAELVRAWHLQRRPEAPATLADFRVAAVVDPFTCAGLSPDCRLLNLRIADVEQHIDSFDPHVLFVESAWRGQGGDWTHKVSPCSGELVRLVDVCRRRAIPTVFWCKEDPAHFDDFIAAAALFDYVFTTDSGCVERYRARLGHDRVGVLGFACQPRLHNPIENGTRKMAASFAGSWYAKYPQRARDFENLMSCVQRVLPVEIYDRNHDRGDPAFEYPEKYRPLIRGGVPYARISEVYKACEFAITVNTITSSPTMFARRVHELLACNTITISNHCVGIDRTYGDRVLMAGRDDLVERLAHLRDSQDARRRLRLRGLREVMIRHTAASRLAQVAGVSVGPVAPDEPAVWVIARAYSDEEAEHLLHLFRAQRHARKQMLLVGPSRASDVSSGIRIIPAADAERPVTDLLPDDAWVAPWHACDYYGPSYLLDLMLATRYADVAAIGKASHFVISDNNPVLESVARPYTRDQDLWLRSSILRPALLGDASLRQVLDGLDGRSWVLTGLAVDEYGYCRHGAGRSAAPQVDVD